MKAKQLVMWIFVGAFLLCGGLAHADSINLAQMYGTASQSSILTYGGITGDAGKAIDGNTDGDWWNSSVAHTQSGSLSWWEVDLGNMYNIDNIVIWNRTDGNQWYLSNFKVSILDANGQEVWSQTYFESGGNPDPSLSIYFSDAIKSGQKVKIELLSNSEYSLCLAEVQVFGDSNPVPIPGAVWLLGSGLVGLAGLRRKFSKKA